MICSIKTNTSEPVNVMKERLQSLIQETVEQLIAKELLPCGIKPKVMVERCKDKQHGDFASNIALILAKPAKMKPRDIAQLLTEHLSGDSIVRKIEVAGPGFINFFLAEGSQFSVVEQILEQGENFGLSKVGQGERVQVEFVSANPTGPLHVGHGRGAAFGATVANLLEAVGFDVHREYYVNDAGRQMNILATSVWLRYQALCGVDIPFPSNGYQGDYIRDMAAQLQQAHGEQFKLSAEEILANVPRDERSDGTGDKEAHIDGLIEKAKSFLGDDYALFFNAALTNILDDIRDDLEEFGVTYQEWFSERSLVTDQTVDKVVKQLQDKGFIYEKEGALWFNSTAFGDDKDRVVVRENGQATYFASDIAYHHNKFARGFDRVINIWGADHHGYIARVMAALKALDLDADKLSVLLVQFAILYRGEERVQMSTRSGSFVTLRELREEVGNDAARFIYVTRKSEQHMDFDLELAKSESKDNPVYYVQYAYARVCSVLKKLEEQRREWDKSTGLANMNLLETEHEQALVSRLSCYPEILERSALHYDPHTVAHYLRELAGDFHTYYNAHKVLIDDDALRNARLALSEAVRQVIYNGLKLLGVSAPQTM